MKNLFPKLNLKVGSFVLIVMAVSSVVYFIPRQASQSFAEDCADKYPISSTATFQNPFPITTGNAAGINCTDFPTLSVARINTADYQSNVSAQNGDELVISGYVHNGARQDLGDADTARNVQASFSVDTTNGSSHAVNVTFTATDNNGNPIPSSSGNITINTPADSHLEVESGSGKILDHNYHVTGGANVSNGSFAVSMGDQQACFEYARFVNFTVKVVANAPTGNTSLVAQPGGQLGSQCVRTGTVTWTNTSNVQSVEVTVQDKTDSSAITSLTGGQAAANNTNNPATTDWLTPGHHYEYVMYDTTSGHTFITSAQEDVPSLNCGGTPPAQQSFNLSVNPTTFCVNDKPTFTINNATSGLYGKQIYWTSSLNGQTQENHIPYGGQTINNSGFWSAQADPYLSNYVGSWVKTASIDGAPDQSVNFTVLPLSDARCGGTPPAQQSFNLSITPNPVCVNSQSSVSITNATSGLNGKQVFWTSTKNGQSTNENLSGYNQFVNNGSWNGVTDFWASSEIGNWVKTASFIDANGHVIATQSASFTVKDCSTPTPQSFNLSITPSKICVGSKSNVSITNATAGLNGKQVFWTSTLNNNGTGENLAGYNQFVSNGSWSGQTDAWTSNEIGQWKKTANFIDNNNNIIAKQDAYFEVVSSSDPFCGGSQTHTYTATATATASASANATCPNGTNASATASASATATATSSVSQADAQSKAQAQAQSQAQAQAQASAQAQATANCPFAPTSFTATATATATASANATCPNGTNASATASASATATATSSVSQADAQSKAQASAQSQAQAQAQASAQAQAQVNCPAAPVTYTATATATASANANATCSNGASATASASASSTATATSSVSQADAQSKAQAQAQQQAQVQAQASAQAQATANCPSNTTYTATATASATATANATCYNGTNASASATASATATATSSVSQADAQSKAQASAQSQAQAQAQASAQAQATASCPFRPTSFTASATSTQTENATVICSDSSSASASATSSASATATSSISQEDAQSKAQASADAQAHQQALTQAQAAAQAKCPVGPKSFTATATETATANASATCSDSSTASASATASATATATSSVSQADAQSKAQAQAHQQALASAQASAQAAAQAKCPTQPPVCQLNTNATLNGSSPIKQGQLYSVTLTWSSFGNHQIKITQTDLASGTENTVAIGSNNGNYTISGLLPGKNYLFKMYDLTCGGNISSTNVNTPANPGQLICTVGSSTIPSGQAANFNANGGTAPYTWNGDGAPTTFTGASYNPVYSNSTQNSVTHIVTLTSADGQTVSCGVVVGGQVQVATSGNCNNSNSSCNNNTNTNNSNNSGTNSSNQNNNNNVNGNNNNIQNTNNNCVNNSCNSNTYYVTQAGNTVPYNQYSQLSITKLVSSYGSGFQNSVTVNNGQTVQFEITVTNTGNITANNVRLTDNMPYGLSLTNSNITVSGSNINNGNSLNNLYLGNLSAGQSVRIDFTATVNTNSGQSVQNTASATADNAAQVQASAWVFINNNQGCTYNCGGGSVNLSYSKKAFNETKNQDATIIAASREDYITYTLTVNNTGSIPANSFVITDDLSQVLPYADMSDNGGGSLNGNTITYPGLTVPANGSVTRSFKVRVKYSLASNLSYVMNNTYGNSVTVRINTPQVVGIFVAPKTGADTMGLAFSGMLTAAAAVFRKRKDLLKIIFT